MNARSAVAEEVCALVDGAASGPVLVFGSLPPAGSDLDLLVRPAEEVALRKALREAGLAEMGRELVRFRCGAAYGVELEPVAELRLPDAELEALFGEAIALPGFRRLSEPAPHHRLLILAHLVLGDSGQLDQRRRQRVQHALSENPSAWQKAAERAGLWGDPERLTRLEEAFRGVRATSRPARVTPRPAPRSARKLARSLVRFRMPGAVIALSGIDGSGKSFQAESLRAVLADLGHVAAIEWVPLASNASLNRIGRPIKRLLARFSSLQPPTESGDGGERVLVPNPGSILRQRSPGVTYAWATFVAVANGLAHARHCARHRLAGRVVIFDRYILDSTVRLRFMYGADRQFRLQQWLIGKLSPPPLCAFLLDVPAETSLRRKEDRWHREELEAQVVLYREEQPGHGVTRLDGESEREALCAEIAEAVWRRLPR